MAPGPIGYTCPDIDEVIRLIENVQTAASELDAAVGYRKNGLLEDLRKANDTLRNWGEELKERVEELEVELSDAKQRIIDLEDEIENRIVEFSEAMERAHD